MIPSSSARPRPRQARAIANDARILSAAEVVLADDGWEDASVLRIAEQAGLSRGAALNRYGDRAGIAVAVWRERLGSVLVEHLGGIVAARGRDGTATTARGLAAALEPFLDADAPTRAAAELLVVSSYQPDLAAAIRESLEPAWAEWIVPARRAVTNADAARNAFLIALALGSVLEARAYPDGRGPDLADDLGIVAAALDRDCEPCRLPRHRASYLEAEPALDPDPVLASLLAATLALVGTDGYEAATINRIAASCGYTSGLVFARYSNKRELFLDATARLLAQAATGSWDYMSSIAATHSGGIADAAFTREVMRPEFRALRTITLEQYRLSWHDAGFLAAFREARDAALEHGVQSQPGLSMERARARAFIGLARGAGIGLLAQLAPDAWSLPYDVVSVPLIDG